MATMALSATGSLLTITTAIHLTSTQVEYDTCQFTFDAAWAGYSKTAVFYADPANVVEVVLVADACDIPWDAFVENKRYLYIGVYGTSGTSVLPTNFVEVAVAPGANIGGAPSETPTASVYLQLLAAYGIVADDIDDLQSDIVGIQADAAVVQSDVSSLDSAVAVVQSDVSSLDSAVAALASGGPAGTYADLAALNLADPDHAHIYITLDDGAWCYHNGAAFVAGGLYQSFSYNPLEFQMFDSLFLETGSFDAVGAKEVSLSRTRTTTVHILDTDVAIQAKTGWKIYIIICDVDGVLISGSGWVTTAQTISGGSYFNIVVARVDDAIHLVADAADALRCDLPSSMLVQAKYGRAVMKIYDADTADFVSMTITQDGGMIVATY